MTSRLRFERELEDLGLSRSLYREFQLAPDSSSCPKCQVSPAIAKSLKLTCHFHVPKNLDAKTGDLVTGSTVLMEPKNMQPYYIDPWLDDINVDRTANGLQTKLENLIKNSYGDYLNKKRKADDKASFNDRIRVALVDLTKKKLSKPEFAGWGSTIPIDGASIPKITALYAVHQLAFDLNHKAVTNTITKKNDLLKAVKECGIKDGFPGRPKLTALFTFTEKAPDSVVINFSDPLKKTIEDMIHHNDNCAVSRLILQLGFNYIASVVFQSGLWHPARGGLWLRRGYCCTSLPEYKHWRETTDEGINTCYVKGKEGRTLYWKNNPMSLPKPVHGHNATAFSVATFFTLLAQGRLVDEPASNAMMATLSHGCTLGNGFGTALTELGGLTKIASKCGIIANHLHESMFIERDGRSYVAVLLTIYAPKFPFKQFLKDLDKIIQDKNP